MIGTDCERVKRLDDDEVFLYNINNFQTNLFDIDGTLSDTPG